jgi:Tol biopolymer transport system component
VLVVLVFALAAVVLAVDIDGRSQAAWPGANGRILYVDRVAGGIWSMEPDGSDRQQLTTEADDNSPSWSPDGAKIVFARGFDVVAFGVEGVVGLPEVWTMNPDGSEEQYVTDGGAPTWNHDGTRILYSFEGDIYEIDPDGSDNQLIIGDPLFTEWLPVYRPGGAEIAYIEIEDTGGGEGIGVGHWEVVVRQPGGLKTQVTDTNNFREGAPDWSPDGSLLTFAGEGDDLYVWSFGSLDPPDAVYPGGSNVPRSPSFSPDGTKIVFSEGVPDVIGPLGTAGIPIDTEKLYIMNPDGTGAEEIPGSAADAMEQQPDWQPLTIETPTPSPSPTETPAPTDTPTPSPTPTPAGPTPVLRELIWADANCDEAVDPVDSLLTLRHDAGLSVNSGGCPPLGTDVEVLEVGAAGLGEGDGDPRTWGDVDCGETIDPVDSLKILRHDADLSVAQETGCPPMAAEVTIQHAP